MWRDQDSLCAIIISLSDVLVAGFCKYEGNMVGITGNMCAKIRETVNNEYGRWCGYSITVKDGRELLILMVYSVNQEIKAGN